MLKLAAQRDSLRVIADQFGAPTSAELLADVTALLLHRLRTDPTLAQQASGLYHLTAQGSTSWHGYAQFVIAAAKARGLPLRCAPEQVQAITTADYPLPAPRPANSRLDCSKLQTTFGIALPAWSLQIQRMLAEVFPAA
jgi:dTDP-4-dehydrorhamnose reductase